jgi:sec-independent protein translocase protein TatA
MPGGSEMFIILAVLLLLFGGSRLPQLAKGMGQSIKEFKKGVAEFEDNARLEGKPRLQSGSRAGDTPDEVRRDARVASGRA